MIGLAIGLVLLVGLITLGGCSKNSASSSNTKLSPGTVVKNSGGMEFAYNFQMGSDHGSTDGRERPIHQVTFASGFYMGRYEVMQAQWQKVRGNNPSTFISKDCGENCPVDYISWNDAQEFIKKLNAQNDGYTYRLPSEAEWEYACRAGTTGDYAGEIKSMAWYDSNSNDKLHPVGQKQPNAWGLFDMHGNVEEWVMDNSHDNYNGAPTDGSAWVSGGDSNSRVWRGGAYSDFDSFINSAARNWASADTRPQSGGIRLVAVPRS